MNRCRHGFTLIELMITVMLLSVGILSVIATVSSMSRYQNLNVMTAELSNLSHSKMDELRVRSVTSLGEDASVSVGGDATSCNPADASNTNFREWGRGESGRRYCLAWQVTETGMPPGTRLLRLRGTLADVVKGPTQDFATLLYVPPKS